MHKSESDGKKPTPSRKLLNSCDSALTPDECIRLSVRSNRSASCQISQSIGQSFSHSVDSQSFTQSQSRQSVSRQPLAL